MARSALPPRRSTAPNASPHQRRGYALIRWQTRLQPLEAAGLGLGDELARSGVYLFAEIVTVGLCCCAEQDVSDQLVGVAFVERVIRD